MWEAGVCANAMASVDSPADDVDADDADATADADAAIAAAKAMMSTGPKIIGKLSGNSDENVMYECEYCGVINCS